MPYFSLWPPLHRGLNESASFRNSCASAWPLFLWYRSFPWLNIQLYFAGAISPKLTRFLALKEAREILANRAEGLEGSWPVGVLSGRDQPGMIRAFARSVQHQTCRCR